METDFTKIVTEKNGDLSVAFVKYSLYQAALGIQSMHTRNILHRDIKSDNILCNRNGEIKLCDLGFGAMLSQDRNWRSTAAGTPSWIAPEIATGEAYNKGVDIWAFGCFAFELATGEPPFHSAFTANLDHQQLFNAIIN